ncbi:MAG: hypothetical protein K2G80_01355 [Bacteroidales bacterium]|nr:hypothetical protein [Bacteroidales bacterium]
MNKYIQKFIVPCYDTDSAWRLKPSSFMNLAQEIANLHAEKLGFGYDDLIGSRTAWVLSRMHMKFVQTPKWKEEVVLSTWHKGLERLFYLRDYTITDSQGRPLVLATSSWLVLNLDTRKLVRDPNIMDQNTMCPENATEMSAPKIQMPKDSMPELVLSHRVAYSDVDLNGHTNNAMYMTWALDAVDYGILSAVPVKEASINFNHETRAGDIVSLYRASVQKDDGLHVYVEGKVGDVSAFCAELIF